MSPWPGPLYLTEYWHIDIIWSPSRGTRVMMPNTCQLIIPRTRTSYSYGDDNISVTGTVYCNAVCGHWSPSEIGWKHFWHIMAHLRLYNWHRGPISIVVIIKTVWMYNVNSTAGQLMELSGVGPMLCTHGCSFRRRQCLDAYCDVGPFAKIIIEKYWIAPQTITVEAAEGLTSLGHRSGLAVGPAAGATAAAPVSQRKYS